MPERSLPVPCIVLSVPSLPFGAGTPSHDGKGTRRGHQIVGRRLTFEDAARYVLGRESVERARGLRFHGSNAWKANAARQ